MDSLDTFLYELTKNRKISACSLRTNFNSQSQLFPSGEYTDINNAIPYSPATHYNTNSEVFKIENNKVHIIGRGNCLYVAIINITGRTEDPCQLLANIEATGTINGRIAFTKSATTFGNNQNASYNMFMLGMFIGNATGDPVDTELTVNLYANTGGGFYVDGLPQLYLCIPMD